jgi:hypothetical protein
MAAEAFRLEDRQPNGQQLLAKPAGGVGPDAADTLAQLKRLVSKSVRCGPRLSHFFTSSGWVAGSRGMGLAARPLWRARRLAFGGRGQAGADKAEADEAELLLLPRCLAARRCTRTSCA